MNLYYGHDGFEKVKWLIYLLLRIFLYVVLRKKLQYSHAEEWEESTPNHEWQSQFIFLEQN
jgi:hypothetical protein